MICVPSQYLKIVPGYYVVAIKHVISPQRLTKFLSNVYLLVVILSGVPRL